MRVLVLGGTWFLGRALVAEALRRGHHVTTFNRGQSGADAAGVEAVRGDRERREDLEKLAAAGPWDIALDPSGLIPRVVATTARILGPLVGRYVFTSTVAAYRGWPTEPLSETSILYEADPDADPGAREWGHYHQGRLKAGCETALLDVLGERLLTLRPGVILGPGEYIGRLPWWLDRVRRGGEVLAPGRPDRSIQPVDVRDVASFALDQAETGALGVFNIAAPLNHSTYGEMLNACATATRTTPEFVWVDEEFLADQEIRQWTELPLWRVDPSAWQVDSAKAVAAGLSCRDLPSTVADTWMWLESGARPVDHPRQAEHGIDPDKERRVLAEWHAYRGASGRR